MSEQHGPGVRQHNPLTTRVNQPNREEGVVRAGEHPIEEERPEDWGWHHEFVTGRQVGGWVTFLILGALFTTTHYNATGDVALLSMMVVLAIGLIWDRRRRRNQWRG